MKLLQLLTLLLFLFSINQSLAVEKHALIIANKDYEHGGSLSNPIKDSRELSRTLKDAGFNVKVMENLTLDGMRRAISDFGWEHSETDNVAMVYYSGHGAEFDGENYLIPVDAKLTDARRARSEAITLSDIQNFMYREISDEDRAKGINANGLNIIVLDACRNNPYPARKKAASRGLSEVEGASGTLIWYAAQPGAQADDGDGRDISPFAEAFTTAIDASAGETVEETFKQVAKLTLRATDGQQEPWQAGNILGRFSFKKGNSSSTKSRILSKFDPSILDASVDLFKFDNPQKISLQNFGIWNLGRYEFIAPPFNETLAFEPGYHWKFSHEQYQTGGSYGSSMWQEFQPNSFAHFSWKNRNYLREKVDPFISLELNIMDFMSSTNCSEDYCNFTYEFSLESEDGSVLSWADAEASRKVNPQCYDFCNFEVSLAALEIPRMNEASFLVFRAKYADKSGIKSKYRKIKVPLVGMKEASEALTELEKFDDTLSELVRFSSLDQFMSDPPAEYADHPARYYLRGISDEQQFIDKYGVREAKKFGILFEKARDIDYSEYGGICSSDLSEYLFRLSPTYMQKMKGNADVSGTLKSAELLWAKLSQVWLSRLSSGDLSCARTFWTTGKASALETIEALLLEVSSPHTDYSDIWNLINIHKHYFPNGDGPLGYLKLRSLADTVDWGEWRVDKPEQVYGYLGIVKKQEIEIMHEKAWDVCLNLTDTSATEGLACYREFVSLFPDSDNLEEATASIKELEDKSKCQTSAAVWNFMSDSINVDKLEEFASKHQGCPQSELALKRIKELEDS